MSRNQLQTTQGKTGLCRELSRLVLAEPPQFTVELVEILPHIPVDLVEPGLTESLLQIPVELVEPVLPHPVSGTSAAPHYGGLWRPRIGNIQQYTSPNFRNPNEFNAAIDINFSNDQIEPPFITQIFSEELSNRSSRDIYTRCWGNLVTEYINPVDPQFVNHGLSDVNGLN